MMKRLFLILITLALILCAHLSSAQNTYLHSTEFISRYTIWLKSFGGSYSIDSPTVKLYDQYVIVSFKDFCLFTDSKGYILGAVSHLDSSDFSKNRDASKTVKLNVAYLESLAGYPSTYRTEQSLFTEYAELIDYIADTEGGLLETDHYSSAYVNSNTGAYISTLYFSSDSTETPLLHYEQLLSVLEADVPLIAKDQSTPLKKSSFALKSNQSISKSTPQPEIMNVSSEYGEFNYKKVARNPEDYIGTKVKLDGHVVQVTGTRTEGYSIRLATNGNYDDILLLRVYSENAPASNILEADDLTVYAVLQGEYTYKTVMGNSITLPIADAKEIVINTID